MRKPFSQQQEHAKRGAIEKLNNMVTGSSCFKRGIKLFVIPSVFRLYIFCISQDLKI